MKALRLSPSALNVFRDCPRCFWLDKVKRLRRPRGIFPSLPGGMDLAVKNYFDEYRGTEKQPPDLQNPECEGAGLFPDQASIELWRNWRTGLEYQDEEGTVLFGAIDDLLVKDGKHIPFDYKTKGSPTTQADAVKYYSNQMDCYALLFAENRLPVADYAILLYYSPKDIGQMGEAAFHVQPIRVPVDPDRARETLRKAAKLLRGPIPPLNGDCEYCLWQTQWTRLQGEVQERRVVRRQPHRLEQGQLFE